VPGDHLTSHYGFGHHLDADESAIPIELRDLEISPGRRATNALIHVDVMSDACRGRAAQCSEGC
jgi:hypothetical protein